MHTILRLPEVKKTTGLSRSTIYFRIAEGAFPKSVSLGGRAVGWLEADIQEWLQRQIETSRNVEATQPNSVVVRRLNTGNTVRVKCADD